ncbi:MAG: gamma carbonic anhydrase family protein [Sphaerochaeta sp.]|nr:gamma carbonic anhydrase family protein [Sphaerochaeta sp.]HBO35041.1 gamma carbonic anhydrase family protein [Sphaerochaeta sp.]
MIAGHNKIQPTIGQQCYIAPTADLIGDVHLQDGASVWFHATLRADVNRITVGEQTNIQDNCVLHVTKAQGLVVGKQCTVGHGAILHACTIEDECLIGMGSIVLDGSQIGRQSLVGAGSVVPPNKNYPPGSLILGSPAKVIRQLTSEELLHMRENTQEYWQFGLDLCEGRQTIG